VTRSALARGVQAADRRSLARAITLVESRRPEDERQALELLNELLPLSVRGLRIGVSGPPGVGKSSLLEGLGMHLIELGRRPFVLVVDPSSPRAGGSILGDKTRMTRLARSPEAFVRPSPSGDSGGSISRAAGDVLCVCEAAGFGPSLVETVGAPVRPSSTSSRRNRVTASCPSVPSPASPLCLSGSSRLPVNPLWERRHGSYRLSTGAGRADRRAVTGEAVPQEPDATGLARHRTWRLTSRE